MQDPTKAIAEAYTKLVLFERWASSKQNDIVEAISLFEEENGVELTEEQIKFVVESFLTESYQ